MATIDLNPLVNDIGTEDALAVVIDGAGYYDGQSCLVRAAVTNTGAATLSISGRTAKALKKLHDQDLEAGDIEAGALIQVRYDATGDVFQVIGGLCV